MTLAISRDNPGAILIPPQASKPLRFAAEQLSYYVALLIGARPELIEGPRQLPPPPTVELSLERAGSGLGAADTAVRLTVHKGRARLTSISPFALVHGVYRLLEDFCGAYWLNRWEGDEYLPRAECLVLPEGEYTWRPRFAVRAFTNFPTIHDDAADFVDWMAKRGFNQYMVNPSLPISWQRYRALLADEMVLRGMEVSLGHHTLPFWVPPDRYFEQHPEWFAVIGGQRRPDGQLCMSNPHLIRFIVERIDAFVQENPEVEEVGLWPRDGYGWCECPDCMERNEGPSWWAGGRYDKRTDRYLRFVNAVAEQVGERHPHLRLTALAYVNYVDPPEHERPLANVVVYFAPFQRCLVHSLDDPACTRRNPHYARMLEQWRESVPGQLRIFSYLMQIDTCSLPLRITETIGRDMEYWAWAGVDGWVMEYAPEEWHTFAANAYLVSHLAWEPVAAADASAEQTLQRYYAALYGPACRDMCGYFSDLIEDFVAACPCTGHYDLSYTIEATPGLLRAALRHLGKARLFAADDRPAWRAANAAHVAAVLLLRMGEWQRAMHRLRQAGEFTRPRRKHLAEQAARRLIDWAQAHAGLKVLHADKIVHRVRRIMQQI